MEAQALNETFSFKKKNGEDQYRTHINPQFLLRVCGLPINMADELSLKACLHQVNELIEIEQDIALLKDILLDHLQSAFETYKSDVKRRRLILKVKRDVFNERQPKNVSKSKEVLEWLSVSQKVDLSRWFDLWQEHGIVANQLEENFQAEIRDVRQRFKEMIKNSDFQKGIFHASPNLYDMIKKYLASDNLKLNKRDRRTERSLLDYFLRTTSKTSPFSTFTPVVSGRFDEDSSKSKQLIDYQIDSMDKVSEVRFNTAVLFAIARKMIQLETVQPALPVSLVSDWAVEDGKLSYLRRSYDMGEVDESANVVLDRVHENIIRLPITTTWETMVTVLKKNNTLPLHELIDELYAKLAGYSTKQQIKEYLLHLLRLGLLFVPHLKIDIHSPNPLQTFYQNLNQIENEISTGVASKLEALESYIAQYGDALPQQRLKIKDAVKQLVKECYERLGDDLTIPKTLLYEDTTFHVNHLAIDLDKWQPLMSDLAEFQRIVPILDANFQRRLVTRGYFRARFGEGAICEDFLTFADNFNSEFFDHYINSSPGFMFFDDDKKLIPSQNHFKLNEIEALENGRQAIADYITKEYANRPENCQEMILDDAFIQEVSKHVPAHLTTFQSHCAFSQFAQEGDENLLILNRLYTGLTTMHSRFSQFLHQPLNLSEIEGNEEQISHALGQHLQSIQPEGAIFAELQGGYESTNLNLHPSYLPYQLVCPGDVSNRPEESQIPLADLYVKDDLESNTLKLYSKRLNKEIIPVYLGFLVPMLLPEIQQVLINFSHASMCPMYMWSGTNAPGTGDTIAYYPRLRYKNLVLHRALWKLNTEFFPKREHGQSDASFFFDVSRWRKQQGLPKYVFVTPDVAQQQNQAPDEDGGGNVFQTKPFFVDFDSYLSVGMLENYIQNAQRMVVLTEMLPSRDQLWLQQNNQEYVTEFIFETSNIGEK